jgi:hypothetical protein
MKLWKEAAFWCWKHQRYGDAAEALGQPATVLIELGFHTNRRRDPHNYVGTVCKAIVDGLVLAGLWEDDNPKWVTLHEPVLTVHKFRNKDEVLPCIVYLKPRMLHPSPNPQGNPHESNEDRRRCKQGLDSGAGQGDLGPQGCKEGGD